MYKTAVPLQQNPVYTCKLTWLQLARPMTWSGTISPVLAGSLFATNAGAFHVGRMVLLLTAALLVQSSANMFNDYFDFKNGQDKERWSKGMQALSANQPFHHHVPYVAAGLIVFAILLGLWLTVLAGWWVAVAGILGIVAGIAYSAGRHSLASLGLGEVTAGLFLGMVLTLLSYSSQTGTIHLPIVIIGLIFSLLISSMVLTNNIRDMKKDEGFRNTLAIRLGQRDAVRMLTGLLAGAYLLIITLVMMEVISPGALVTLAALPLALRVPVSFQETRKEKEFAMKRASYHHWAFGLLFVIGLLL